MTKASSQFQAPDDGRGLYPATVRVGVPRELPAVLMEAATAEGCTIAEFVRRAIVVRLEVHEKEAANAVL